MNAKLFIPIFSLFVLSSCVKDKPEDIPTVVLSPNASKVFVINEGNFGSSNASISVFDRNSGKVVEDYYKSQNKVSLGDVAQSMSKIGPYYYIVVNNSAKIMVCDTALKIKQTIVGLSSPRYIVGINAQKAYVSDINANELHIIDLNLGAKTGAVHLPGKTEQMVLLNNKVYVTNTSKKYVYVVNTASNTVSDSIDVGLNAGSLVVDKNNKLWVLSSGTSTVAGKLSLIDPVNNSVSWSQSFANTAEKAAYLCINGTKDTLYYANKDGICRMPIVSTTLPGAFITSTSNIYGLGIHPTRFEVYVADAVDYVSRSRIYAYKTSDGSALGNFQAGLISNGFYFE